MFTQACIDTSAVKGKLEELGMWESCCIHFWIFALDSLEKQLFVCKDPERQKEIYQYLQKEGLKLLGVLEDPFFERLSSGYQKQFRTHLPAEVTQCGGWLQGKGAAGGQSSLPGGNLSAGTRRLPKNSDCRR